MGPLVPFGHKWLGYPVVLLSDWAQDCSDSLGNGDHPPVVGPVVAGERTGSNIVWISYKLAPPLRIGYLVEGFIEFTAKYIDNTARTSCKLAHVHAYREKINNVISFKKCIYIKVFELI